MAAIIPAVAVGVAVGDELPKFFDDAFDQLGAGEGIYLRDGEPTSTVVRIGQAIGRAYCRAYNANSESYSPDKAVRIEKACRPYLDSIGEPGGPGLVLPFEGGQCDGVTYNITVRTTTLDLDGNDNTVRTDTRSNIFGPITGVQVKNLNPNNPQGETVVITRAGRADVTVVSGNSCPNGCFRDPEIVSIVRTDGQADTCGNPPLVPTIPDREPDPNPPPFRFSPGPGTDISIDVDINPDATITFDIGTGPITVDPFPDPPGDGGGNGGGGGGGGAPPTPDPGEPGTGGETGSGAGGQGGEIDGEAPEGFVLTGLKLSVLGRPPSARRFSTEVDRGVAYIYMGTPTEGLGLEPSGANLRNGQFVYAQKDYLTSWSVRATPGYNLLVIPYYREKVENGSAND